MTDDILDRLYAAFTDPHATRGPQLLADAHREILALRREVAESALWLASAERRVDRERIVAEASARVLTTRVEDLTAQRDSARDQLSRARLAERNRRYQEAEYHQTITRLADEIRRTYTRTPAAAPLLVDKALKVITRANQLHARRRDAIALPQLVAS